MSWVTGNLDHWPKSRSMSEACGRRGTYSVGSKVKRIRAILLKTGCDEKQREMSRGLNNSLDIQSDSALPE